jgi:hypothetical protein
MEFLLGITVITSLLVVVGCFGIIRSLQNEKKDLLNRLLSKNYAEYATFETKKEENRQKPVEKKDLFADPDVYPVN